MQVELDDTASAWVVRGPAHLQDRAMLVPLTSAATLRQLTARPRLRLEGQVIWGDREDDLAQSKAVALGR